MDEEVKSVFTSGPMVSFRHSRKLGSYLVRGKSTLPKQWLGLLDLINHDA